MIKATSALIIWSLSSRLLLAQFDLLTPFESSRIVQRIPAVVEAVKEQKCPITTEVTQPDPQRPFSLEVEARCGDFHDRYVVNRRTGKVTTWGDNPSEVGDSATKAFAQQFVTAAMSRALSTEESRCLAVEGARSLPGWGNQTGSLSIQTLRAAVLPPDTIFQVRLKSLNPSTEVAALIYVDPRTGHVRNMGSSTEVLSAGLTELLATLSALRYPALLSDQDAVSIALKIPAISTVADRKNCSLIVSSVLTPEEAQIASACDGHYLDRPKVTVNLRDGQVIDTDTRENIATPETSLLASRLVSTAREVHMQLREKVDAECGDASRH